MQMLSSSLVHGTLRARRDGTHARYHDEQQSDVHSGKNKRTLMLPLKRWRIPNSGVNKWCNNANRTPDTGTSMHSLYGVHASFMLT